MKLFDLFAWLALGACTTPDHSTPGDGMPIDPDGGGPSPSSVTCPALSLPTVPPEALYVDAAAPASGTGARTAPFQAIEDALAVAGPRPIFIAAGTYREALLIRSSTGLYGGFTRDFAARTDGCATILEGGAQTAITVTPNVVHFTLDGMTVQRSARGLSIDDDATTGTAVEIASSVFAENGLVDVVGGAAFLSNVDAKVTRSVFRDNRAAKGAAIAHGGADATIAIADSVFVGNTGHSDHGGALYLTPKSATITRNTFRSNVIGKTAGYGWGGAVIVFRSGAAPASADFAYNVFTDNLASVGGAVFIDDGASATMSHDLLYRNRSIRENGVARGAALYVDGLDGPSTTSRLVADHLTVANNNYGEDGIATDMTAGGAVYLEAYASAAFTNSIFWNNGGDALFGGPTTSISVGYSIAPAACTGGPACTIGTGVFEPAAIDFADEAMDDYHEKSTAGRFSKGAFVLDSVSSPAIDKGDPAADASAEPAPNGARANLGAFGGTPEASKSP